MDAYGQVREMPVEDKSSGTGLIQTLKLPPYNIPVKEVERSNDKLTRCLDALPYIESGMVCIPEAAPFTNDFVLEAESFTADDSHDFDDQLDPLFDATSDMLYAGNKLRIWASLGKKAEDGRVASAKRVDGTVRDRIATPASRTARSLLMGR